MKKVNKKFNSALTLCVCIFVGGLIWNHQWMKKCYEKRQQAYVAFSKRFPNDGSLPFGSLLVLKDRSIAIVVNGGLRKGFSEAKFLDNNVVGEVQEYYPPNVTGQKNERA